MTLCRVTLADGFACSPFIRTLLLTLSETGGNGVVSCWAEGESFDAVLLSDASGSNLFVDSG